MFELTISKQQLLTPLLTVAGAVDKKQSVAILSHLLLKLENQQLLLTGTDLEIEITARVDCSSEQSTGTITVPTKKMVDIIRSLDDDATPLISFNANVVTIKQGRSQFKLATLPADDYPSSKDDQSNIEFQLPKADLSYLLQSTHFAISQQDVRVYLNTLLLDIEPKLISAVSTDGHRMAISRFICDLNQEHSKLLIPKKSVQEILRLLGSVDDEDVLISAGQNHIRLVTKQYTLTSKLVDTRFPPYHKAIPRSQDKQVIIDRDLMKRALSRMIILASEKSHAVLLHIQPGQLTLIANNQEQEEATEVLEAETEGDSLQIGVNASYLLDVLNQIAEGRVRLSFSTTDSSILVEPFQNDLYQYIIMPMKI